MNNRLIIALVLGFVGISSPMAEAKLNALTFTNASDQDVYLYYGHETKPANELAKAVKVLQPGSGFSLKHYSTKTPTYFFISFDGPSEARRMGYWFKVACGKSINVKIVDYIKKMSGGSAFVAPIIIPRAILHESEITLLNDDLQDVESVKDIRDGKHTYLLSSVTF